MVIALLEGDAVAAAMHPPGPVRILIVDDHAPFREGAAAVLRLEEGVEVVAEAADGAEALELLEREPVDVVLMDVDMPRLDGLTATERVVARWPRTRVIVLSGAGSPELEAAAVAAGAAAYLCKSRLADLAAEVLAIGSPEQC
jgi:DNA-binding NarL/FixJ family response regulator